MEDIIFCKSGGCTAKLGAGALSKVLSKLDKKQDENLLVGFDSNDDGAVYKINENQALVTTLDFFPPMVEDPYLFGQIAATNALSDIYAMGGEVKTALNIVCFPENLDMNILGKILQGGNDKVKEAGGVLVGGHSIADEDIKYGLSVTGIVHPDRIYKNNACQMADSIILTKKLGVGMMCMAHKMKDLSDEDFKEVTDSMTFLNKYAANILKEYEVHAVSDVTGFGFLVHLNEMLDGNFSAVIDSNKINYFGKCPYCVEEFYLTGAAQKNRNFIGDKVKFETDNFTMEEILFDPQTSGGLIICTKKEYAEKIVKQMNSNNIPASIVGEITEKNNYNIYVR